MSEWMRVSVCEIGTRRRTPLSLPPMWPYRRAPSPDSSSALHVWKWKSIMPFTRLPALRATEIYIFPHPFPASPRNQFASSGAREIRVANDTKSNLYLQLTTPQLSTGIYSIFTSSLTLALSPSSQSSWIWLREGKGKARFVRSVEFVGFWSQPHVVNRFKLRVSELWNQFDWWRFRVHAVRIYHYDILYIRDILIPCPNQIWHDTISLLFPLKIIFHIICFFHIPLH